MVREQIEARGIRNPDVLRAMRSTPRHLFVPIAVRPYAYSDQPLPIGFGQSISQPYIVALMTELLAPKKADRVLEIGTGSGYQTAVLARLSRHVYSIEIVAALAKPAKERLAAMGYGNVTARQGDGYQGWPGEAPFDRILLTAASPDIPGAPSTSSPIPAGWSPRSVESVRAGTGRRRQIRHRGIHRRAVAPVRFVPMVPE